MNRSGKVSQADKFKEAARQSGAAESEEAFERRLKRIAKAPPPKDDKKDKKKPGK